MWKMLPPIRLLVWTEKFEQKNKDKYYYKNILILHKIWMFPRFAEEIPEYLISSFQLYWMHTTVLSAFQRK